MNPFHWQSESNFGDALNTWLWDRLLPGFRDVHPDTWLVGVGTVLGGDMLPRTGRKLVLGSGCGYGRPSQLTPPGD
jgi:succinoglycan biosynthesis protein ExoV